VRGRDHNQPNRWVVEGTVKVREPAHPVAQFRHGGGADLGIAGHNPVQFQVGLAPDQRTMERTSCQAMTDHNRWDHLHFPP
jgi:hypothetical protein